MLLRRFARPLLATAFVADGVDALIHPEPRSKAAKRTAFLKDVSLLGGLMIASADTEGKPSLGWRGRRAASNATAAVSAALPFTATDSATGDALRRHAHDAAVRARELGDVAAV